MHGVVHAERAYEKHRTTEYPEKAHKRSGLVPHDVAEIPLGAERKLFPKPRFFYREFFYFFGRVWS